MCVCVCVCVYRCVCKRCSTQSTTTGPLMSSQSHQVHTHARTHAHTQHTHTHASPGRMLALFAYRPHTYACVFMCALVNAGVGTVTTATHASVCVVATLHM